MTSPKNPHDIRMQGFSRRTTVEVAWNWIDNHTSVPLTAEMIPLTSAAGRVLATEIVSQVDVPGFDRGMMDGYALRAAETAGAGPYQRLEFAIIGQSFPGRPFTGEVRPGEAIRIMTGAAMPAGADAVLPAEHAAEEQGKLFALEELTPGKHVGRRGEDVTIGTTVLSAGRRLRPQDVGLLSSLGFHELSVVKRPRVRIIITGNELLATGSLPSGHQIVDSNGPMLQALVARDCGEVVVGAIVRDDPAAVREALLAEADVLLISGGSSVGLEDHAPRLVAELGELAIHGIAMRPSSPAGMGTIGGKLVFLLPGNPVSCLCAYDFFAGRAIRRLGGLASAWPYPAVTLKLARKLVSQVGRVDYARVKIVNDEVEPISISGASLLRTTTEASGFVVIPADSEGFAAGDVVTVYRYDL